MPPNIFRHEAGMQSLWCFVFSLPERVSLQGLAILIFLVITIPMGQSFKCVKFSAWRQTNVENDVILGLQVVLGEEQLWDNLTNIGVADGDGLGMSVKDDGRQAGVIEASGQASRYLVRRVGGVLSEGLR